MNPSRNSNDYRRAWRACSRTYATHWLFLCGISFRWTNIRTPACSRSTACVENLTRCFTRLSPNNVQSHPVNAPECLLTDLFEMTYDDGTVMPDLELRDAIVTVLAAGHDTTALSLAWAFEQILPRADVVERIESELEDVCGKGLPQPEHMASLEYLDAAIRESLRIRSIIPFVVRVLKDTFSVGGFTYPKGIVLCPSIYLLHMREDLYPEPRTYRPERFLERKFAPHEWDPFGGGNRACLGQAFALYEMKVVLATLFSVLKMVRPAGAVSKPARRGIAIGPHDGTRLQATRR